MTVGETYELNKEIYNKEAIEFIKDRLEKKGNMTHRPFEMMTYYSRHICERINHDLYLVFIGYVKEIKYSEHRVIERYTGKKDDAKLYTLKELIKMFGFEISINPNSKANKLILTNAT